MLNDDSTHCAYILLEKYKRESKTLSIAYHKSEKYFRNMYKWLSYPIIITSAVSSILAGIKHPFENSEYVLMGLSLITLILSGFNQSINPKDKEKSANQFSTEFEEIASNIQQFIWENNKTKSEIKAYSTLIHESLNHWKSLKPAIQDRFIAQAKLENTSRIRNTQNYRTPKEQKKRTIEHSRREDSTSLAVPLADKVGVGRHNTNTSQSQFLIDV
jgi:hypothetical protein